MTEAPPEDSRKHSSTGTKVQCVVPSLVIADNTHRRDSLLSSRAASPVKKALPKTNLEIKNLNIDNTLPTRRCTCLDCAPDLYLETIHAHELQRFRRGKSTLAFLQRESLQLAHLAVASFHPSFLSGQDSSTSVDNPLTAPGRLTFGQHHALQQWKHWLRDPWFRSVRRTLSLSAYGPGLLFRTPVSAFNQLFFLGQLPNPNAKLKVLWSPAGTRRRAHSHTFDDGQSVIWINADYPAHFLSLKALMDTLLHELCHVFLQRHSCYLGGGFGCERNQVCVELCQENYGTTGHGRAWQTIAAAVEKAAPGLLGIEWRLDLGRVECAVQEIIAPERG